MALPSRAETIAVISGAARAATLFQKTRLLLLNQLSEPASAAGLARKLGLPRQRLNYHLRQLEQEGLVEFVEERRRGNCVERLFRAAARSFVISPEALGKLGTTAEAAGDRYSSACLMSAAALTLRDVARLESQAREQKKRLATLTLEAEVRFASAAARAAFADELTEVLARLVTRYHDDKTTGGRRFRLMTVAHPVLADAPAGAGEGPAKTHRGGRSGTSD